MSSYASRHYFVIAFTVLLFLYHGPRAVSQPPTSALKKANALFKAKKWKEASEVYRKIVETQPKNGFAWFRLGYSLHAAGNLKKAVETHQKAATFPQARSAALYNLSCAHALLGNKDAAFQALNKAIDAGFNNKKMLQADSDLKLLRKDARYRQCLARIEQAKQLYRRFDFWVGDWNVFNKQGKKIGTNLIQKAEGGHLLIENWDNLKGGTGKSINFVDPVDKKWKQVWVDKGGGLVRYQGEFKKGAMHFTGFSINKKGQKELARAIFTPLPDGRVRQFIQHSKDGGTTWYVYFDGYYVRKRASVNSEDSK